MITVIRTAQTNLTQAKERLAWATSLRANQAAEAVSQAAKQLEIAKALHTIEEEVAHAVDAHILAQMVPAVTEAPSPAEGSSTAPQVTVAEPAGAEQKRTLRERLCAVLRRLSRGADKIETPGETTMPSSTYVPDIVMTSTEAQIRNSLLENMKHTYGFRELAVHAAKAAQDEMEIANREYQKAADAQASATRALTRAMDCLEEANAKAAKAHRDLQQAIRFLQAHHPPADGANWFDKFGVKPDPKAWEDPQ